MTNSWKSKWYAPSFFHLGKLNISIAFRYNLPKNSAIVAEQKHETMYDEVINKVRIRWLNFNWPLSCSLYQIVFQFFSTKLSILLAVPRRIRCVLPSGLSARTIK